MSKSNLKITRESKDKADSDEGPELKFLSKWSMQRLVEALMRGYVCIKYAFGRGKAEERFVFYKPPVLASVTDSDYIYGFICWSSPPPTLSSPPSNFRSLPLTTISDLLVGKKTHAFEKSRQANFQREVCCFSIKAQGRTLDLVCPNEDIRNLFLIAVWRMNEAAVKAQASGRNQGVRALNIVGVPEHKNSILAYILATENKLTPTAVPASPSPAIAPSTPNNRASAALASSSSSSSSTSSSSSATAATPSIPIHRPTASSPRHGAMVPKTEYSSKSMNSMTFRSLASAVSSPASLKPITTNHSSDDEQDVFAMSAAAMAVSPQSAASIFSGSTSAFAPVTLPATAASGAPNAAGRALLNALSDPVTSSSSSSSSASPPFTNFAELLKAYESLTAAFTAEKAANEWFRSSSNTIVEEEKVMAEENQKLKESEATLKLKEDCRRLKDENEKLRSDKRGMEDGVKALRATVEGEKDRIKAHFQRELEENKRVFERICKENEENKFRVFKSEFTESIRKQMEEKYDSWKKAEESLVKDVRKKEREIDVLKNSLSDAVQEGEKAEKERRKADDERKKLEEERKRMKDELDKEKEKSAKAAEEMEKHSALAITQHIDASAASEEEKKVLRVQLSQLEKDLSESKRSYDKLKEEYRAFRSNMEQDLEEYENELNEQKVKAMDKDKALEKLENEREEWQKAKQDLERMLKDLQMAKQQQQEEYEKKAHSTATVTPSDSAEKQNEELLRLRLQNQSLLDQISDSSAKLEDSSKKYKVLEGALKSLTEKNEQIHKKLIRDYEKEKKTLNEQLQRSKETAEKLQQQLTESEEAAANQKEDEDKANDKVKVLQEDCKRLEKELSALQSETDSLSSELKDWESKSAQWENERSEHENKLSELRQQVDDAKKSKAEAVEKEKKVALEAAKTEARSEWEAKVKSSEKEVQSLKTILSRQLVDNEEKIQEKNASILALSEEKSHLSSELKMFRMYVLDEKEKSEFAEKERRKEREEKEKEKRERERSEIEAKEVTEKYKKEQKLKAILQEKIFQYENEIFTMKKEKENSVNTGAATANSSSQKDYKNFEQMKTILQTQIKISNELESKLIESEMFVSKLKSEKDNWKALANTIKEKESERKRTEREKRRKLTGRRVIEVDEKRKQICLRLVIPCASTDGKNGDSINGNTEESGEELVLREPASESAGEDDDESFEHEFMQDEKDLEQQPQQHNQSLHQHKPSLKSPVALSVSSPGMSAVSAASVASPRSPPIKSVPEILASAIPYPPFHTRPPSQSFSALSSSASSSVSASASSYSPGFIAMPSPSQAKLSNASGGFNVKSGTLTFAIGESRHIRPPPIRPVSGSYALPRSPSPLSPANSEPSTPQATAEKDKESGPPTITSSMYETLSKTPRKHMATASMSAAIASPTPGGKSAQSLIRPPTVATPPSTAPNSSNTPVTLPAPVPTASVGGSAIASAVTNPNIVPSTIAASSSSTVSALASPTASGLQKPKVFPNSGSSSGADGNTQSG